MAPSGRAPAPAPAPASGSGSGPRPEAGFDDVWTERVRGVYEEVRGPLWRALVAWSGSTDVADEAVAEGFAQLLRRGPEVRDPSAWVWRASFRLAAGDLQRRRAMAARRLDGGGSGSGSPVGRGRGDRQGGHGGRDGDGGHGRDPLDLLVGPVDRLPDDAVDLVRALAHLSDQQRRCVALVDVAGHTATSAAAVLGTSAATVRVQLMRARRHLRTLLDDPEAPR